jgi:hypothetical protein
MSDDPEIERRMAGYRPGWDAMGNIDRFRAFVAKQFDECDLEDVRRFEVALIADGVEPAGRQIILDHVDSVLWSSRWQSVPLTCSRCGSSSMVEMAQIRSSGERVYHCIECDRCWDTPDAVIASRTSGTWSERLAALKWWHLAPVPER